MKKHLVILSLILLCSCSSGNSSPLALNGLSHDEIKALWKKEALESSDASALYAMRKGLFDYTGFSFKGLEGYTSEYCWILDDSSSLEGQKYAMNNSFLVELSKDGTPVYVFDFFNVYGSSLSALSSDDISKLTITSSFKETEEALLEGAKRKNVQFYIDGVLVGTQVRKWVSNHYVVADNDISESLDVLSHFKSGLTMSDFRISGTEV